jgi:hypothetical protein
MEDFSIKLSDLPNEMLTFILRKLSNVEVLCSIIGVNQRLNTIAYDSIFTSQLTLYFVDELISPLPDPILDRFCLQILPQIHHQIKWLNLESRSMERILLATNYPNLNGLGLYNIDVAQALTLFDSKLFELSMNEKWRINQLKIL